MSGYGLWAGISGVPMVTRISIATAHVLPRAGHFYSKVYHATSAMICPTPITPDFNAAFTCNLYLFKDS